MYLLIFYSHCNLATHCNSLTYAIQASGFGILLSLTCALCTYLSIKSNKFINKKRIKFGTILFCSKGKKCILHIWCHSKFNTLIEKDHLGDWSPEKTPKMASAQVVETSVTNNSPSQDSNHPDGLFQSRYVTPGFKPFSHLANLM